MRLRLSLLHTSLPCRPSRPYPVAMFSTESSPFGEALTIRVSLCTFTELGLINMLQVASLEEGGVSYHTATRGRQISVRSGC